MSNLPSMDYVFYFSSTIGVLFATCILSGVYCLFRKKINTAISEEGSLIAKDIVVSADMEVATEKLTKNLLNRKDLIDETSKFAISVFSDQAVQKLILDNIRDILKTESIKNEAKLFISSLITDPSIQKDFEKIIAELMKNDEVRKVLNDLLASILVNDQIKLAIQDFLIDILKNARLKNEVYNTLKGLLTEFTQDPDMNVILVKFISTTLMNSLNEPVNEKFIKDKIVELLTSTDVMDSVSKSIMDVVKRDDLKKIIGDSAVDAVGLGIRKHYPRSLGLLI